MAQTCDDPVGEVAEWTRDQAERGGGERPGLREFAEDGAHGFGAGEDALLRSAGGVDGEDGAGTGADAGAGDEGGGARGVGGDEAQA